MKNFEFRMKNSEARLDFHSNFFHSFLLIVERPATRRASGGVDPVLSHRSATV